MFSLCEYVKNIQHFQSRTRPLPSTSVSYNLCCCRVSACPSVRPSVRPSLAHIVSKRLDESSWVLAWRLPSTYPTLYYEEIGVSLKTRALPSGTLSQLRTLKKNSPRRSRCQQNSSSSSSSTVELVDDTYTTIDESWLFTTSRRTVIDFLWICCSIIVSTVDKIDTTRRAVRLR